MAFYFAPINLLSNYVYRHIVLQNGADYVFSELIMVNNLEKAIEDDKLKIIKEDIQRTIFQIGVSNPEEVKQGIKFIKEQIQSPIEININMGCPHSSMKKMKICGGLLFEIPLLGELAKTLVENLKESKIIPSVKLRSGTNPETILIQKYLDELLKNGIKKVYIHARTLRHSYHSPARYEFLTKLREKYSEMKLIFNGDIDGREAYEKIGEGDVMIGRAALINPFIFQDIKNKIKYPTGAYDPALKDPNYIHQRNITLNKKKIKIINTYLDLAIGYKLRKKLYSGNMSWLTKGVSNAAKLHKQINTSKDAKEAKKLFEEWLEEN